MLLREIERMQVHCDLVTRHPVDSVTVVFMWLAAWVTEPARAIEGGEAEVTVHERLGLVVNDIVDRLTQS